MAGFFHCGFLCDKIRKDELPKIFFTCHFMIKEFSCVS